jgi:hypothetical protein
MDAIRGLVQPGFYDAALGYYPYEGWTVVEKADPRLLPYATGSAAMVTILTDVTEGDPRYGQYPVISEPDTEPGPPKPTYEELEAQVGSLTTENAQLQSTNDTLTSENATLTTQNSDLSTQVTDLTGQVSTLTEQMQTTDAALTQCQEDLAAAGGGATSTRKGK